MLQANRRAIACGEVRVQFVASKDLASTSVVSKNTPRGTLTVAAPEATALELVGYAEHCGGLSNIVTVLAELVEVIEPEKLLAAAELAPVVWTQRLGFLLERFEHRELADALVPLVQERARAFAPRVHALP